MTKRVNPKDRPYDHMSQKNQVANRKARRRRRKSAEPVSALDVIVDKKLTVKRGEVEREITVEEALQHQT